VTPRAPGTLAVLRLCAAEERLLATRSRWTQIFAAAFALLSLAVAGSGYILSGGYGIQDFSRVSVSLVQLVLLLVPLTALLLGIMTLLPERGAAELLYSQPAARGAILLGKVLGLFEALVAAQAIGFGAAGLVVYNQSGESGIGGFLLLGLAAAALTAIFLGLAALICAGNMGQRRSRALAIGLVVWFVAVVLFDLAAIGVASLLRSGSASRLLIVAALVNPVDAIRTGTLLGMEGTAAFGAASLALLRFTNGPLGAAALIAGSTLLWLILPPWLAARRLSRADI
jgi:Cu-processing system permease protein